MRATCVVLVGLAVGCDRSKPTEPAQRETKPEVTVRSDAKPKRDIVVTPKPAFPPDDWTHKELADYLASKGVVVDVSPVEIFSQPGHICAAFRAEGVEYGGVHVFLCDTPTAARERAGTMGADAMHKGRFAIGVAKNGASDDEKRNGLDLYRRIAAALK